MNRFFLSIQIVIIFSIAISVSFLGDHLHEFLGDWKCGGYEHEYVNGALKILNKSCLYIQQDHNPTWHWGWRHWLFMLMGLSLFAIQAYFIFNPKKKDE